MEQWEKETADHIGKVQRIVFTMTVILRNRVMEHDASKLQDLEKEIFKEFTPKLKGSTYGSEEYKSFLRDMEPALNHHYRENRHHPEHHPNGIQDMDMLDLMEMLGDWMAASLRHSDGDIMRSIEMNQERFGYSDELKRLFMNTVPYLKRAVC